MSRRTHEKELARARAKRQAERAAQQRTRRLVAAGVVAVVAIAAIAVGLALQGGGDPDPAAGGGATEQPTDAGTALTEPPDTGTAAATPEAQEATCPAPPDDVPEPTGQQWESPPEMALDESASYTATIETTCGTITVDLFAADAPLAVNNFVFLARQGFYDGVVFHRVIDGFMIQGGDPTGTGSGGPGYQFADELDTVEQHGVGRGMLAMANAGPDTNGSQFFIVQGDASHLTTHTVFGEVTDGMEVVDDIAAMPTDPADRPTHDVAILSVEVTEEPA